MEKLPSRKEKRMKLGDERIFNHLNEKPSPEGSKIQG